MSVFFIKEIFRIFTLLLFVPCLASAFWEMGGVSPRISRRALVTAGVSSIVAVGSARLLSNRNLLAPMEDMRGKTILVTGANTGLGFESALALAQMGADVYLGCRSRIKGEEAAKTISNNPLVVQVGGKASFVMLDLSSLSSIEHFAKQFAPVKLDVLINNAGVMAVPQRELTKDGFELQIGVNHFGHFLLTCQLLSKLARSEDARIINVSSAAHAIPPGVIRLDDINFDMENQYGRWTAYGQSKLANILFTGELQRRATISGLTNITTMSLHPGVCRTDLSRYLFNPEEVLPVFLPLLAIASLFTKSPKEGAQTQVFCASNPDLKRTGGGKYFVASRPVLPTSAALDQSVAEKLWTLSEHVTKCSFDFNGAAAVL
jgi:retinol dehydrogenase-12